MQKFQRSSYSLYLAHRRFAAQAASEYTSIDQNTYYEPVNKINFNENGKLVFFERSQEAVRKVPYEMKSASVNAAASFVALNILSMPFNLGAFYSIAGAGIAGTWFYRVLNFMTNAVVKAELH